MSRFSSVSGSTVSGRSCLRDSSRYSQSSGQLSVTSRSRPQHWEQISPPTAGHCRRGRLVLQILQSIMGTCIIGTCIMGTWQTRPIIVWPAYNRLMIRTHLFLKVEVEHDENEEPEKIGDEIARQVSKLYVVRSVELSSVVTQPE